MAPWLLRERFLDIDIGPGSYGDLRLLRWGPTPTLRIGAYCSFAHGAQIICGGEHHVDWTTTYPFSAVWSEGADIPGHPTDRGDIVIGNDVWVGAEAMILSGVTVGDGAVIGARAVVGCDVPPYGVAVGVPARVVRRRFDDATVARLLAIQWWRWSEERIARLLPLMLNTNVAAFLDAAEREHHEP